MSTKKEWREGARTHFNQLGEIQTAQMKGEPCPPLQKTVPEGATLIDLPEVKETLLKNSKVLDCINNRRSRRKYNNEPLSLEELSFLLNSTQRVHRLFQRGEDYAVALRVVPSAGARHPFETYVIANRIKGLKQGIYRYLGIEHKLLYEERIDYSSDTITEAANGQEFVGNAPLTLVWAAIPYRTEWRYDIESTKLILLDAGHVCQNLYIATEALGLGTCGIAAYDQKKIDRALQLDGEDEFVVYLAPVGRI